MIFSEVPNAVIDRNWRNVSILLSNVFRVRCLSKDNQFRISLAIGYTDVDAVPIIVSQKTLYVQSAVWQEVRIPLRGEYQALGLSIYARISDVQWGSRGQTGFLLKEGDSMIYDSVTTKDIALGSQIVGESHSVHAPAALVAAPGLVTIAANPKRRRGFIQNLLSNPVFVYFGPASAAVGDKQTARVAKGGRIDIPENYTGVITIDVKGQFTPDASLLSSVQYLATDDI